MGREECPSCGAHQFDDELGSCHACGYEEVADLGLFDNYNEEPPWEP